MDHQPQYRIQAVSDATGVPAATLRVWERRYGVPKPMRAENSYRLYSERDIEMIRSMASLCARGTSPSEAARVVREQFGKNSGRDEPTDQIDEIVARVIDAARGLDAERVEDLVKKSLMMGSGFEIYQHILGPVMYEIGEAWARGDLGIAEEHLVTQVILRVLRDMLRMTQPAQSNFRILMACAAHEPHEGPLLGAALFAAQRGWRTILLGPLTPPEALGSAIQRIEPEAIGLSITTPIHGLDAEQLVASYGAVCMGRSWIVGGRAGGLYSEPVHRFGGVVASCLDDMKMFLSRVDLGHPLS